MNSAIRSFHDELKSLVLTCAPSFPKVARGGLTFISEIVDLQGAIASYHKQVLVILFESSNDTEAPRLVMAGAKNFLRSWEERGTLPQKEGRSETQIDSAIRKRIRVLRQQLLALGENDMRALCSGENIPEMLYYLATVVQALSWYADRYLARLTGELAKMEA